MIEILIAFIAILFLFYLKNYDSFDNPNVKYQKHDAYVKDETIESVLEYPNESIDLLFDASFNPLCCPSTYTTSSGCLCYEPKNFNLLATRGGNSMSNPL
jgi:hypothetical protein